MKKLRVCNLYCGIGGNRRLWNEVAQKNGIELEITAVERDEKIANIYHDFFPNDKIVIADAHQYLLEHFQEYDFIWSSPPCPSHSQLRFNLGFKANRKYAKVKAIYPDMKLYEEIILLKHWYKGLWVVENTIPYYEPLVQGNKTGGHIWWSNFLITEIPFTNRNHRGGTVESLQERKGFDLSKYPIKEKRLILRNCVEPELGKHILDLAIHPIQLQKTIF